MFYCSNRMQVYCSFKTMLAGVRECEGMWEGVWESMRECEGVWESVRKCDRVWESLRECERVWGSVRECERVQEQGFYRHLKILQSEVCAFRIQILYTSNRRHEKRCMYFAATPVSRRYPNRKKLCDIEN